MRIALAFLSVVAAFGMSCGKKAVAPVLAVAPPPKPPNIQLLPARYMEEAVSAATVSNTVITWEAILVQFKVDDAERHGLAKMFAEPGKKNPVIEKQSALSLLAQIARADTNIVLQLASGPYAARTTLEDSTNMLLHLQGSFGVDILSQPRITTKGTNEALLQVSNARTIVLGGAKSSDTNALRTTNIWVGPSVSVQLLGQNERGIVVEAAARLEEFHGYLSENSDAPRPKFVVSTMGTRTQLQTNEVLLLGGPIQMNVVRTSERVAYLSDIPAIGRLFTETQVHTNFVRTLVLVRPTLKN